MRFAKSRAMSERGRLMRQADVLFSKLIRAERGRCEVHDRQCNKIGLSHILSKSTHPRLRYCRVNVIACCWGNHFFVHHDHRHPQAKLHEAYIVKTLGPNYEDGLRVIEATQPRLTAFQVQMYILAFKKQLEEMGL